jgi:dolichol-phosphate mannosyltransferase
VASLPHAQRIERIETDRYGSMTVRVITYEPAAGPLPARAPVPAALAQLIRFCCVGASGYVLNLAVFRAADGWMPYLPAFALAFVLSALSNFLWNRLWTFAGAAGRAHHQLARFLSVSAGALALDLTLLAGMVELAGLPKLAAAALAIAVVTPLSFVTNRRWSFDGG